MVSVMKLTKQWSNGCGIMPLVSSGGSTMQWGIRQDLLWLGQLALQGLAAQAANITDSVTLYLTNHRAYQR